MFLNRRALKWSATLVLVLSTALLAQQKDDKTQDDKKSEAQKRDFGNRQDRAAAHPGQLPNDWPDLGPRRLPQSREQPRIRAVHSPIDATKATPAVAFYWRVVAQNAGASATPRFHGKERRQRQKMRRRRQQSAYGEPYITPSGGAQARLGRPFW